MNCLCVFLSACLPKLNTLQITHNRLTTASDIQELERCDNLSVVDMSHNRLEDPEIVNVLANMKICVSQSTLPPYLSEGLQPHISNRQSMRSYYKHLLRTLLPKHHGVKDHLLLLPFHYGTTCRINSFVQNFPQDSPNQDFITFPFIMSLRHEHLQMVPTHYKCPLLLLLLYYTFSFQKFSQVVKQFTTASYSFQSAFLLGEVCVSTMCKSLRVYSVGNEKNKRFQIQHSSKKIYPWCYCKPNLIILTPRKVSNPTKDVFSCISDVHFYQRSFAVALFENLFLSSVGSLHYQQNKNSSKEICA